MFAVPYLEEMTMIHPVIYIDHDNAEFFSNEHALLVWWTPRRMCVVLR